MIANVLPLIVAFWLLKYLRWLNSSFVQKLAKIPGSKGLPFIGILAELPRDKYGKCKKCSFFFNCLYMRLH